MTPGLARVTQGKSDGSLNLKPEARGLRGCAEMGQSPGCLGRDAGVRHGRGLLFDIIRCSGLSGDACTTL